MSAEFVRVEAPARLHMGLLDLRGDLGRRYGSLGASLSSPTAVIEARRSNHLSVDGEESERVLGFARLYLANEEIDGGAEISVRSVLPAHSGLGSGTQLALATAAALATLHGRSTEPRALARAVGRGRRSAIGTWAFGSGGFLVDGGVREGASGPAPLLFRHDMPANWRCVVAIADVPAGRSGPAEEAAFRRLRPPAELSHRVAHLVLGGLLPSLAEGDLGGFGSALTQIQRLVGQMFAPEQGQVFAHPVLNQLVEGMLAAGAAGAGQSSWGPAVFGLVDGDLAASKLVAEVAPRVSDDAVFVTSFDNRGARIESR